MYCYSCTVCSFTKRCIDLLTVVYCYIFVCFLLWFYLNNGWWLSLAINIADISSLVCYDCFVQFLSPFNLEMNSDIAYSISSFVIFYHPHGNVKGDVCIYLYTEYWDVAGVVICFIVFNSVLLLLGWCICTCILSTVQLKILMKYLFN